MTRESLERILERAVHAPSGDNVQPWLFSFDGASLVVACDTAADTSFYNTDQCASFAAIGALITNIELAAATEGLRADATVSADGSVRVTFAEGATIDPLQEFIEARCSNRKVFRATPIPESALEKFRAVPRLGLANVHFATGDAKDAIATACSANEIVVLENSDMHDFLFNHISWTHDSDAENPRFFVDTLELKGPQLIAFKLYARRMGARILNGLGIAHVVAKHNAAIYRSAPLVATVCVQDDSVHAYIDAGKLLQRIWLIATQAGLAAQPMAGVPLLARSIRKGNTYTLSRAHLDLILDAESCIAATLPGSIHPFLCLRVGYAEQTSARTRRRAVGIADTVA